MPSQVAEENVDIRTELGFDTKQIWTLSSRACHVPHFGVEALSEQG